MLTRPTTVLIVDDEPHLRASLVELLKGGGYHAEEAGNGDDALAMIGARGMVPDVIVLDLKMPGRGGLAVLDALKAGEETRNVPVVVLTSYGGSEPTIQAMKAGAYDYLTKPFDADDLMRLIRRATEVSRLNREVARLTRVRSEGEQEGIVGRHPLMQHVFKVIGKVAGTDATVLLTGESGTGKELVAQAIHRHSPRASRPFVAVNCAAIPDALLESELFGHERGAFTGAVQSTVGRFGAADGGTLFLDEITELSAGLQAKLLRVLQERVVERLGGARPYPVDLRVIAATNRDPTHLVREGRFREDLLYRLDVVRIDLPPLRARRSDIPLLIDAFLRRYRHEHGAGPSALGDDALHALLFYEYPGNVRELHNLIERACVLARGPLIRLEDLPGLQSGGPARGLDPELRDLLTMPLPQATASLERLLISRALTTANGNKAEAARLLNIHRQHLYAKLKELGLDDPAT